MAATMTLDEARKVLAALKYAKADGFSMKKAQEKIDEVLESPDNFEGDAKKVKDKEVKKLIDTIWDAVEDEDEIEVVEDDEEDEDEDDDDDGDEDEDDEDDDERPAKKKTGKKPAKASKNGKPKKKESAGKVERDEFNRSINSQAHRINEAITKEGQTAAEIAEECGAESIASVTSHLRNLVQQEYIKCKKIGNVIQFFRKGGKPVEKDDDDDDKPVKKTGKKVKTEKDAKKGKKKAKAGKK